MNSKLWIRKALSMCLSVAVLATYSMVALAGPGRAAGEYAHGKHEALPAPVRGRARQLSAGARFRAESFPEAHPQ